MTVWSIHVGRVLSVPYVLVLEGSVVRHTAYGLTRYHAMKRAARWLTNHLEEKP